jgi:hypothetical protein
LAQQASRRVGVMPTGKARYVIDVIVDVKAMTKKVLPRCRGK